MRVRVRYFAWLREKIGRGEEDRELPPGVDTITALIAHLKTLGPEYEDAFTYDHVVRAAIDQRHVKADASLAGAREVAFFPPVTGG
jgi:sulfur-carrier protein